MNQKNYGRTLAMVLAVVSLGGSAINGRAEDAPKAPTVPGVPTPPNIVHASTNRPPEAFARPAAQPSWEASLTDEQKKIYKEAMDQQQTETRAITEKLRPARHDLQMAIYGDSFDEAKITEKRNAVSKLELELAISQAKAFQKYKPFLPADQIERRRGNLVPRMNSGTNSIPRFSQTNRVDAVRPPTPVAK
jgi:hypothetical protein